MSSWRQRDSSDGQSSGRGGSRGGRGAGRGYGRGRGQSRGFHQHEERGPVQTEDIRPIGYLKLQALCVQETEPHELLSAFNNPRTGLLALVNCPDLSDNEERFDMVIGLLRKAVLCRSAPTILTPLVAQVGLGSFFNCVADRFTAMSMIGSSSAQFSWVPVRNFVDIAEVTLSLHPSLGKTIYKTVLMAQTMTAEDPEDTADLRKKLVALVKRIKDAALQQKRVQEEKEKPIEKKVDDDGVPPEDFRELPIFPTEEEVHSKEKPFLRRIKNAYTDVDHYLDVQFRLLREDFLSPLRDGIEEYISASKGEMMANKRNSSIHVYRNVKVLTSVKIDSGVAHSLMFNPGRRINWSKRLIYGSFVCLSHDNFSTILFGSVANSSEDGLKGGRFEAQFEEHSLKMMQAKDAFLREYVMVETSAFFEMYKPVLASLQKITALPFEENIVRGSTDVSIPAYLSQDDLVFYDLTAIKAKGCEGDLSVRIPGGRYSEVPKSDAGSTLAISKPLQLQTGLIHPKSIPMTWRRQNQHLTPATLSEMMEWPTCEDLGLNESQFEAFQAGITRGLAVIQGPPGTGKTYVGLKIVETLLRNKWTWSRDFEGRPDSDEDSAPTTTHVYPSIGEAGDTTGVPGRSISCMDKSPPILVVCYTNHALDQFLEGIQKFCPEGILRIGRRSKSASLEKCCMYNVSRRDEFRSKYSSQAMSSMYDELGMFRETDHHLELRALACRKGVLKFESIKEHIELRHVEQLSGALEGVPEDETMLLWLGVSRDLVEREEIIESQRKHVVRRSSSQSSAWWVVGGNILPVMQKAKGGRRGKLNVEMVQGQLDTSLWISNDMESAGDVLGDRDGHSDMTPPPEETTDGGNTDAALAPNVADVEDSEAQRRGQTQDSRLKKLDEEADGSTHDLIENLESVLKQKPSQQTKEQTADSNGEWRTVGKKKSVRIDKEKERANHILSKIKSGSHMSPEDASSVRDVWGLSQENRWRLYRWWVANYTTSLHVEAGRGFEEYNEACRKLTEIKRGRDLKVMQSAEVVGLTTTGAARYWDLLQELKPRIVVVEEAAEVLEAHIVTTLTEACQHLILIGDHQQLRPNPGVYELAKKYKLELSLFERLFTNNVPHTTLQVQHRMRPEISVFMRNIYERIDDHPSVQEYPHVKGMTRDVFFISHCEPESRSEDASHSNEYEAKFCLSLSEYLMKQGYTSDQVTILTMYSGQLVLFKKLMRKNPAFETVRSYVTSVDNYQGEENEIIILSLVRSNEEGSLGFIAQDNRVCVALSRAKMGMYVIGNFDMICQKSKLWKKIIDQAKGSGHAGKHLPLMCERHSMETMVSSSEDFSKVYQGGCSQLCSHRRACGHSCGQACHSEDEKHVDKYADCYKDCAEKNPCGHACTKKCYEPCDPCTTEVYYKLICGHRHSRRCGDPESAHCVTLVQRDFSCGHTAKMECSVKLSDYKCTYIVTKELPCEHEAQVMCHIRPVDHQCLEEVSKTLPCSHNADLACSTKVHEFVCKIRVSRVLPCGHYGEFECHEKDFTKYHCREPCSAILGCKHTCFGNCGSCHKSRLHVPCTQPCPRILPCGHKCVGPCTGDCPPCLKLCKTKCEHSKCGSKCGLPCKPCREQCGWYCPHERCSKKCSEPCDRRPCQAFCDFYYFCPICKVPQWCLGMCGEPCISICMYCPLPVMLQGNRVLPDAGYVRLPDCGHIYLMTTMDAVMGEALALGGDPRKAACPLCGVPVRNCRRYSGRLCDFVERVETAKRRAYGTESDRRSLVAKIQLYNCYDAGVHWEMSKTSLNAVLFRVKLLDITSELKTRMQRLCCSAELIGDTEVLKNFAGKRRPFISDNEYDDVKRELNRLVRATKVSGAGSGSSGASSTTLQTHGCGSSPLFGCVLGDSGESQFLETEETEEPAVEETEEPAVEETEDGSVESGEATVDLSQYVMEF